MLLVAVVAVVNAISLPSTAPADVDGDYVVTAAWNLATEGVFSTSRDDGPLDHHPGREPLFPALLAGAILVDAVVHGGGVVDDLDVDCVVEGTSPACRAPNARWKLLNGVLLLCLVGLTWATARLWLPPAWALAPTAVVATSTSVLGYVDTYYTEVLAALLLLAASAASVQLQRSGRRRWAVAGGLSLGLLALTKAIFLYVIPLVAAVVWLVGDRTTRDARTAHGRVVAVLVVAALSLPVAWMARNAVAGEGWVITRGADAVLMTRLSYDTLTAREAGAAILYCATPTHGPDLAAALLPEDAHARLDRDDPDGYYQGHERVRDEVDRDGLGTVLARRAVPHVVLTPLLLYRGAVPWAQFDVDGPAVHVGDLAAELIGRTYLPAMAVLAWWGWRRRRSSLALFVTPALASFALYAGMTHFMPRYSVPAVGVGALAVAVAAHALWRRGRSEDRRATGAAPPPSPVAEDVSA